METGQNINQALEYARKLFSDLGKLAILAVLNLVPIVNWVVTGYMAKVIRETPSTNSPPKLENYGTLWIDGLKIIVVVAAYMLIPVFLIALGAISLFAPFSLSPDRFPFRLVGAGLGTVLFIVGIVLAFVIAIIMSMAVVHMIKMGMIGKAFALSEIFGVIQKIGWRSYIVWLIVISMGAFVVGFVGAIPTIGWLISLVMSPFFGVFVSRSAALMYTSATASSISTAAASRIFCMHCGKEMPGDAIFCPFCGKPQ